MDKDKANSRTTQKKLDKRNRLKWFSYHLSGLLYYNNPESTLHNSYKNTFYCADTLISGEGKLTAKYCKNRWCPTCQRNKTGMMICAYAPRLKQCEKLKFLTLTRPNVSAEELKCEIRLYYDLWRKLSKNRWFSKYTKSGKIGLRKMECTYNPEKDNYHPHFHILIEGYDMAKKIRDEWLKLCPESSISAQKIKHVKGDGGYLEVFKYFTKLIAKDNSGRRFFDPIHMNTIFESMSGTRVYGRIGSKESWQCEEIDEDGESEIATIPWDGPEGEYFKWMDSEDFFGYYSIESGESITSIEAKGRIIDIILDAEQKYPKK